MGLTGNTNEEKIWNFLYSKIKNEFGVAGLMGNLHAESGLNPKNLQNTGNTKLGMADDDYVNAVDNGTYTNFVRDSQGFGICQWTYWNRKQNLLNYAKTCGCSIGNLEMQLNFLIHELQTSYKSVWNKLLSSTSVRQASDVVLTEFEKPANQGESVKVKRASFGQQYYDKFNKNNNEVIESTAKYYRVQCGAFSNVNNAKSLQLELKNNGFNSVIKNIGGLYKVQVGAFGNKDNASNMLKRISDKGFNGIVVYY